MSKIGIVEGFFGPAWPVADRKSWAPFLSRYGGDFYIYAPKRDPYLRKRWREEWPQSELDHLVSTLKEFQHHDIKFGVGFSPFELGSVISAEDWRLLEEKFRFLANLRIDLLGLFFDDMPVNDSLLETQGQVVELALKFFPSGLIFCPSYYSFDPILDKVFGQRPEGYVEGLGPRIPSAAEICWTGPKVISETIPEEHLQEVTQILRRKPFLWENLYANDGPRNCKFLKFKYFTGRTRLLDYCSGVGFNLMNQSELSKLLYLSSMLALKHNLDGASAFARACDELYSPDFRTFLLKHRERFLSDGLDRIPPEEKSELRQECSAFSEPAAREICCWLDGEYLVGPECLTD